jgi:hypothetical protein
MQAEITFSANTIGRKNIGRQNILSFVKPVSKFQKFIEEGRWYDHLLGYEKYINRFSWAIIIASIVFFFPFCLNIFIR